jgi:uncharacterized GH25 family protein
MKKIAFGITLFALFTVLTAHEFWLEPTTYFAEIGQPVKINLRVGENFTGEKWDAGISRITHFSSFLKDKETNWLNVLQNRGLDSLDCRFSEQGTHLVALKTNSKFIELEAEKFNDYLRDDGLDAVLKTRIESGDTLKKGREFYHREAASLIQVGKNVPSVLFENTNFDLKIIPEKNPLSVASGTPINFKITFKNKPFSNALVCHWHKTEGKVVVVKLRSDTKGQVQFKPQKGDNMISVVQMVEFDNKTEADWQSIWGNLTFGVK